MIDTPLTNAFGWALLHFLWQGVVIGAVAWTLLRMLRQASARYLLAVAALALMPLSLAVTAALGYRAASRSSHPTGPVWRPSGVLSVRPAESPAGQPISATPDDQKAIQSGSGQASASASLDPGASREPERAGLSAAVSPRLPFLVAAWLIGVLLLSIRLLAGWFAARHLVRDGTRPAGDEHQRMFRRLVQRLGLGRAVRLLESTVAAVPSVVGWLRPVILLPASALTGLTPAQIEVLLAHELAHVRRYDYLVNLVQCAIETLLFYHPVVWLLSRRVRGERELCCDDLAVSLTGNPREYAEALLALERIRAVPRLAMAATGGALLPRIRRLVEPEHALAEAFPHWLAGAGVVALLAGATISANLSGVEVKLPSLLGGREVPAPVPDPPASERTALQATDSARGRPGVAPDTVIAHPDPSRPLAERVAWARSQYGRRTGAFWVAYSVRPPASVRGAMYVGSATMFTDDGKTFMSGSMVAFGDASKFHAPGTQLLSVLGGRPDDVAILLGFDGDRLDDPAAVSLSLAFDFHGRPVYWLGPADDAQSIALTRDFLSRTRVLKEREQLVRMIGVHRSSELVVPLLVGILESGESAEVREDAAAWLGRHPRMEALSALDRAARRDRSRDVRKEAAESVGEMQLPEAFDVLVRLARELDVAEVRQEAVESLGEREEPDAARVLGEIARNDRDRDVQREAAETLGDLSDGRGLPVLKDLALTHPSAAVRSEAVETWAEAAPGNQAVALLESVAEKDPSGDVRREAVEGLTELRDGQGVPVVLRFARQHRDPDLRREAVERVAPHLSAADAFAFLKGVSESDPSSDVRREAVETLGDLQDERAIPILAGIADKQMDEDVAREAAETLGDIKGPAAVEALTRIARAHPLEEVMAEAVETLGEQRETAALAVVADIAATHPRARIRAEAVETYGENARAADALTLFRKVIATEQSEEVLSEIFETAVDLDGADGVGFVVEVVKASSNQRVRGIAGHKLKNTDDRRAKAAVRELRLDD